MIETIVRNIVARMRKEGYRQQPIIEPVSVSSDLELKQNEVIVLNNYQGSGNLHTANAVYQTGQKTETICRGFVRFYKNTNLVATGYKITLR